ncbi:MAG: toxin [Candidatus Hydrogenedentota bacterium]
MRFDWNLEKNNWLKENRGVTFDEITCLIDEGHLIAVLKHPAKKNQKIFIVERDGYAYNVPFIEQDNGICFMKTIYPSRISTKKYIRRNI